MSNQVPVVLTNANQSFTDTQKAQGRTNIGAASGADLAAATIQTKFSTLTPESEINSRLFAAITNVAISDNN